MELAGEGHVAMLSAPARGNSRHLGKAASAFFLLLSLAFWSGCQGVSAGNTTPPSGTLSLGDLSLNFGSVTAGNSETLSVTASNTGNATITISFVTISSKYFSLMSPSLPATIAAGQSTTVGVKFTPNVAGTFTATVAITSDASSAPTNLSLSGTGVAAATGGQLSANPNTKAFGNVAVGTTQSQTVTLTNTGTSSVNISQAAASGAGFQLSGLTTPLTLNASQSTAFTISFTPQSAGTVTGNVTITSDASNSTLTIPLSGIGTTGAAGQLTVTPTTLPLGNVVDGTSGTASGSLTASGADVTVTAASTNNSVFSVGGLSLPVTIPAGHSASFTVTFSPQTSGAASATLTFTSNAQPATTTESLTGTGTAAPTHTVSLSWNASSSSDISGYNIYRAVYTSSCGSFGKINTALNTGTLYTDSGVADGTSYCYAATAVNSSNEESGYSNIVSNVKIPAN
jgi:hypothetical protein